MATVKLVEVLSSAVKRCQAGVVEPNRNCQEAVLLIGVLARQHAVPGGWDAGRATSAEPDGPSARGWQRHVFMGSRCGDNPTSNVQLIVIHHPNSQYFQFSMSEKKG